MSINRNQAHASTLAALTARQGLADTVFIAAVNTQIATADILGRSEITATTNTNMNLVNIYLYYVALGYEVYFPDYANQHAGIWPGLYNQAADLFGWFWVEYWANKVNLYGVQNPCRLTLRWEPNKPFRIEPETGGFTPQE